MAAVAAVTVGLVGAYVGTAPRTPDDPPAPVAQSIYAVDWTDTELTVPENPDCPEGKLRLYRRQNADGAWIGTTDPNTREDVYQLVTTGAVVFGDVTGDGQPEAIVRVQCLRGPKEWSEHQGEQLLVVRMLPDHSLDGLGFVGTRGAEFPSVSVDDEGLLHVQMRYNWITPNSFAFSFWDTAFTQVLRWNGSSFGRVSGRADPLNFTGASSGYGVPTQLADILSPSGEVLCPAALVPFGLVERGSEPWHVDGYDYSVGEWSSATAKLDVDGDGNEELVVPIRCTGPGYDEVSLYVLAQGTDRFLAIDVPVANDGRWTVVSAQSVSGQLQVQVEEANGTGVHTLAWNGERFEPGMGSYRLAP